MSYQDNLRKERNALGSRNLKVGNFHKNVKRGMPNMDKFRNFSSRFLNSDLLKDYDAYLWGSFPERKTPDVDILLNKRTGAPSTAEMEEISIAGLEESLLNNNFLADVGFTQQEVRPFTDYLMHYQRTGKPANTNGNVYGDRWYLDGKLWKDRTKGITKLDGSKGGYSRMSHNMVNIEGELPYRKQLDRKDQFGAIYAGKPLKIKNSGEKY